MFEAMASPVRREILSVLSYQGECSAGEISDRVSQVARSSVSTHLRLLRMAGLVTERRDGRRRLYTLNAHEGAADALSFLQTVFDASLRTSAPRQVEADEARHSQAETG